MRPVAPVGLTAFRPPVSRRPLRRAAFALAPTLVLLLFGEAAARVWLYAVADPAQYPRFAVPEEFPQAAKYRPHPYFCYALQPGYRRGGCTHNSQGCRGRSATMPKPPGIWRIAVLGGSTTYGEFIERDEDTFPAQLEAALRRRLGSDAVEVVNAGVPGYNSWESLADFQFRVLDWQPDVAVAYFGVNDVHCRLVHPAAYAGDNTGRRAVWQDPPEVRILRWTCLGRVVGGWAGLWRLPGVDSYVQAPTSDPGAEGPSAALGGDPQCALDANPPSYFRRNLASFVGVARAHGVRPVLATWACSTLVGDYVASPHYRRGVAELNEVVRSTAAELGTDVLDHAAQMPDDPPLWRDGRHVNAAGAARQAEMFAEFLAPMAPPELAGSATRASASHSQGR